ncbi:hypothetical protein HPB52_001395 [Rhipicephalus sanguineus]|uniref:Uncharacterized protein n=1 Tax=Rhipicephalus sanguineus TaxID=34632 RepID=A0A9D4QCR7_RHISA|nr:hypothetical protein HPB52_001395 [Rhipicephalus sanguineus]
MVCERNQHCQETLRIEVVSAATGTETFGGRQRQGSVTKVSQGQPAPDIRYLELRAARRRAERQALSKGLPELWTCFRRVDAVCRRHARRRRNQGWLKGWSPCWRLLKCLLPRAYNQVLSVAILLAIPASELAERLANQFAGRKVAQLATTPPPAALPCPASCHHPGWVVAQV